MDAKPRDGLRRPASETGVVGMLDGLGDRGGFDTEVLELGAGRREVTLGVSQMLLECIAGFRRCCRDAVNVDILLYRLVVFGEVIECCRRIQQLDCRCCHLCVSDNSQRKTAATAIVSSLRMEMSETKPQRHVITVCCTSWIPRHLLSAVLGPGWQIG